MKKLSPQQHREILAEMQLAALFNVKSWARRYNISPRTVKRLKAEALERMARIAQKGPIHCQVTVFNSNSGPPPRPTVAAAPLGPQTPSVAPAGPAMTAAVCSNKNSDGDQTRRAKA